MFHATNPTAGSEQPLQSKHIQLMTASTAVHVNQSDTRECRPSLKQRSRLFIVPGVSEQTHFATQTRKEISEIAVGLYKLNPVDTIA
jgi:hypothetical protein